MASTVVLLSLLFLTCSTFMLPSNSHSINYTNEGFTISIIHRDSPESPLYNPSMTLYETRIAQFRRSISRIKHLSSHASAIFSQPNNNNPANTSGSVQVFYDPESFEYIVIVYVGTPQTKVFAFVDTGSDTIWVKGKYFRPPDSKTYKQLSCNSSECQLLGDARNCKGGPCTYEFAYADGSKTSGVLSNDNFAIGPRDPEKRMKVGPLNFGVSNASSGLLEGKQQGCLALNRGPLSFISQLGIKRFSHCLAPLERESGRGSTLSFGSSAVIRSEHLTPFDQIASPLEHYYVNLQGISVGNTRVPIPPGTFNVTPSSGEGGFVLDCGTPYTMLIKKAYDPFLALMGRSLPKHVKLYRHDNRLDCFKGTQKDLDGIPPVTFHFAPRVDVKLTKERTFVNLGGIWCLAIAESYIDRLSLLGSNQMANFNVGYDLERKGVSFAEADCSASTSGGA